MDVGPPDVELIVLGAVQGKSAKQCAVKEGFFVELAIIEICIKEFCINELGLLREIRTHEFSGFFEMGPIEVRCVFELRIREVSCFIEMGPNEVGSVELRLFEVRRLVKL